MKKWLFAVVLLGVAGIGFYLWLNSSSESSRLSENASSTSSTSHDEVSAIRPLTNAAGSQPGFADSSTATPAASLPAVVAPASATHAPGTTAVASPDPSGLPPATALENMRVAIRLYGSMFGGNPVGTNPEITQALNGDNPKQSNFIRSEAGVRINGQGELIDSWGTPYFFHQLSGTEMEIHSAGPDRKMWTADDLVTK